MDIINAPFKFILEFFMAICNNNYILGIILFTIVINIALIPLSIKQQKSMAKQSRLRPKLDAIKARCGDDRMKYSTEMNELYQREGASPTSGCLPMVIRMVIIIGVLGGVNEVIDPGRAGQAVSTLTSDYNFYLFGLDLSQFPKFDINIIKSFQPIWIIPILCFIANIGSIIVSNQQQKMNNPDMAQAGDAMKGMLFILPVFSLVFTFSVRGAVGFYWICSSVVNTLIQLYVNKHYSADKMLAVQMAKNGHDRKVYEAKRKGTAE